MWCSPATLPRTSTLSRRESNLPGIYDESGASKKTLVTSHAETNCGNPTNTRLLPSKTSKALEPNRPCWRPARPSRGTQLPHGDVPVPVPSPLILRLCRPPQPIGHPSFKKTAPAGLESNFITRNRKTGAIIRSSARHMGTLYFHARVLRCGALLPHFAGRRSRIVWCSPPTHTLRRTAIPDCVMLSSHTSSDSDVDSLPERVDVRLSVGTSDLQRTNFLERTHRTQQ